MAWCARVIAGPGEHRPALGNGINLAFVIARRSQRSPIIEVGAAIPAAIPALLLEVLAQVRRLSFAAFDERQVTSPAGHLGELRQHVIEEKAQPDAFALALDPHPIHAVVPVAGANQR